MENAARRGKHFPLSLCLSVCAGFLRICALEWSLDVFGTTLRMRIEGLNDRQHMNVAPIQVLVIRFIQIPCACSPWSTACWVCLGQMMGVPAGSCVYAEQVPWKSG